MRDFNINFLVSFVATCVVMLVSPAQGADCPPADTASYTVTFDAVWSQQTHPQDFPSNPHFSGLVGGTHKDLISFWQVGSLASNGIESMAETGSKTLLIGEVNAQITQGNAGEVISGPGVGTSPGQAVDTFTATQEFPLATVVSMIAPSPDWFVGVSGLPLFEAGAWKDEVVVSLQPYDAGTDSGIMYTSPNMNTQPPKPIFEITGYPFLNGGMVPPLGTFTFKRIYEDCLSLCVMNLQAGQQATFHVSRGEPGEELAILYGTQPGQWNFSGLGWTVAFEFLVTPQSATSQLVATGMFDPTGEFSQAVSVPANLSGLAIKFQAAMKNTAPNTCMSNLVDTVIL